MAKKKSTSDWVTPTGRVKWLLEHRHGGSRSGMAKATGVSLTGLIKVVTGQQTPGRRLLETIARDPNISPAWLFAGEGQPLKATTVPVVPTCVPEPPAATTGATHVPDLVDLYSPTRYWLRLERSEPVVKASGTGVMTGDLMLMETDRSAFPVPERLDGRWGVARVASQGGPVLRLVAFEYVRESDEYDAFLQAETFTQHPQTVRRIVIDELPDGTIEASKRAVRLEQPADDGGGRRRQGRWASSILPQAVAPDDVVAVCVLLVRGFEPTA